MKTMRLQGRIHARAILGAATAVVMMLFLSISEVAAKAPEWVEKRPKSDAYYNGIGIQSKSADIDYRQAARDLALNDLASEITVNISGETIRNVAEKAGLIEEDYRSLVRSTTQAELTDYKLVDTWENKEAYFVYFQLSKALYRAQQQAKIDAAVDLALDLFSKSVEHENQGQIEKAILYAIQALYPIEKYLAEPLEVEFQGQSIYLFNEIYASLQRLLSGIEFRCNAQEISATFGRGVSRPVGVQVNYFSRSGSAVPVANLPVEFAFTRGSGDLIGLVRSDRTGSAETVISKITASDSRQVLRARLNLSAFLHADASPIVEKIVNRLPLNDCTQIFQVRGLTAYVKSREVHFGQPLQVLKLEPALKNILTQKGFTCLDRPGSADLLIDLQAESRRGAEMYGMYSSFVELTISVVDARTGEEIYKNILHDIKGLDLNYDKAGLKAFENGAEQVQTELVPKLMQFIQK